MIDSLWAYGQRLRVEGRTTPLAELQQALHYPSLDDALRHVREVGRACRAAQMGSVIIALTGMGRVSRGALEVARHLEPELVAPEALGAWELRPGFHLALFDVGDLVERRDGGRVDTQEYRAHPERYRSAFARTLHDIDILVNGIYWEPRYPRLVTKGDVQAAWNASSAPRLKVIGDISCDIEGSIELTVRPCDPGDPTYVWDVHTESAIPGFEGAGPVLMATDILPTELPRDASLAFSEALVDLVPALAAADPDAPLADWPLPPELRRAVILHHGELTPEYAYLSRYL
jgi:alpha-aminoadipic semialdehyde synthase